RLRKVEPMQRALKELGVATWIAGLRRSQSRSRAKIDFLERKDGRWKLHPIADWTDRDVGQYLTRHALPYHPLWDKGYVSIGDVHTTRPLTADIGVEETRFFGLKRECGLHFEEEALSGLGRTRCTAGQARRVKRHVRIQPDRLNTHLPGMDRSSPPPARGTGDTRLQ